MYNWNIIVWAFLPVVLCKSIISKDKAQESNEERWLSDGIFYDYMADAPVGEATDQFEDKCPPVPESLIDGACDAVTCNSDRECSDESYKCCYNGCTYTCRPKVQPPPFVDWIHAPRRRLSSGRSWLINGPDTESEVEICSTSPVEYDEDPLMCPHGYYCNIEDNGDEKKGIPNRGHCVKNFDDHPLAPLMDDWQAKDPTEESNKTPHKQNGCIMDDQLILEEASVQIDGKICHCKSGDLLCKDA